VRGCDAHHRTEADFRGPIWLNAVIPLYESPTILA
jgi:hypothetical protein